MTPLGGANPIIHSVHPQPNGQIIIAGQFTTANGNNVVRLHGNTGGLDDNFRPAPTSQVSQLGADNVVRSLALQSDGLLLISGDFSTYKVPGNPQPLSAGPRIARVGGL